VVFLETSKGPIRRVVLCGVTVAVLLLAGGDLSAAVDHSFKLDHFGYSTSSEKIAVITRDPGATVQIRSLDGTVQFTVPTDGGAITSLGFDPVRSGDSVWEIDFSAFATPGTYELHAPSLGSGTSYPFDIRDDVYNEVARVALKAFYLQRCNTPKLAVHVGEWSDEQACHLSDEATSAADGHTDRGVRDLKGGWHDAGDYNKYVWQDTAVAVWSLLTSYERNPTAFGDDLGIPESGNGVADVLDEVRWEIEWLRKMQLNDGSVLKQTRGVGVGSPPSADNFPRGYHDPDAESAAVFVGSLALASRIFRNEGFANYAGELRAAALESWGWLQTQPDDDLKVWAAAELLRGSPNRADARDYVENYVNWGNQWFEIDAWEWRAAAAYLATPFADAGVRAGMESRYNEHVNMIFDWDDSYGAGMADWQYYWGSNRPRGLYGLFLLTAADFGHTGNRTAAEAREHAEDYLHYLHGRNPLNMVYLSNMSALGGEHSVYQLYHAWLGDSQNPFSLANYIGLPFGASEEDYPYFKGVDNFGISDFKFSTYGPPPGILPGGPNSSYGFNGDEAFPPAGSNYYELYYRDWSDQTVWTARTWEINENSISYQGPYVGLVSAFVEAAGNDSSKTALRR